VKHGLMRLGRFISRASDHYFCILAEPLLPPLRGPPHGRGQAKLLQAITNSGAKVRLALGTS
jgi:hypothetical protein